jgi:hypothetical protein
MISTMAIAWRFLLGIWLASALAAQAATGGLVGVVGAGAAGGRPLLWSLRDGGSPDLVVQALADGAVPYFAWCEAGHPERVHGGANVAGLGVAAVLVAVDGLAEAEAKLAALLQEALRTCRTLAELEELLQKGDADGRGFAANLAALDAAGAAAMFDVQQKTWARADATVADRGFLVRDGRIPVSSQPADGRRALAEAACRSPGVTELSARIVLQRVLRDVTPPTGAPRSPAGRLDTRALVHRQSTTGALVVQGVANGENSAWTQMWVALGQPLCSTAMPLFPAAGAVPRPVAGDPRSALAAESQRLQQLLYVAEDGDEAKDRRWLRTDLLAPLRRALLYHEAETFALLDEALANWRKGVADGAAPGPEGGVAAAPPRPQLRVFQEAMTKRLQQELVDQRKQCEAASRPPGK